MFRYEREDREGSPLVMTRNHFSSFTVGYNSSGMLSTKVDADGVTRTYQYNPSTVTVNGTNVDVLKGKFEAQVPVTTGTNQIPITATDSNGHTTSRWAVVNVTGDTARTYQYDLNGNLVNDGNRTFTWDARNRLTSIRYGTDPNTPAAESDFSYDGQDRRVAIVENDENGNATSTKNLLWIGTEIAEERDGSNEVTKRYFRNGMQTVGSSGNSSFYYTRDHLGSIRELTDATGAMRTRYDYDPYGRRTTMRVGGSGNIDADFGFTGHYHHDPSDLWLTLFRGYTADDGRWLTPDPLEDAEMQQGPNLFEYVNNNPVVRIDPSGLLMTAFGFAGQMCHCWVTGGTWSNPVNFEFGGNLVKCMEAQAYTGFWGSAITSVVSGGVLYVIGATGVSGAAGGVVLGMTNYAAAAAYCKQKKCYYKK